MSNRNGHNNGRDRRIDVARQELPKLFDRLPPVNAEAEAAVLGSMILDSRCVGDVVNVIAGAEDFYTVVYGTIYSAIVGLWNEKATVDIVELKTRLANNDQLEEIGGVDRLVGLAESVPSAAMAPHYANLVRQAATTRSLIDVLSQSLYDCYHPGNDVEGMLDQIESRVFNACESSTTSETAKLGDVLQEAFDRLEAEDGQSITGIETGFFELDELLSGLQPGDLVIVAARPSMGKTAFALNMAEHIACTSGRPTAFYSLEMSRQQVGQRMLCARSGVDSHKLRRNMLSADEFARLSLTVGELSDSPLHINDRGGLTLMQLRADARRLVSRHDVACIFVDYLQLMTAPGAESRQVEVSNLSRGIKALARELKVPVVCLSQLNRQSTQREGHRPRMSELRESGSIEQDADVVMLLHREDYYHKGDVDYQPTNQAEVIIEKQRMGDTGVVRLVWDGPATRFRNMARDAAGMW